MVEEKYISKKKQTYSDYLKTPEGAGYELVKGMVMESPAPYSNHQIIAGELHYFLLDYVKKKNLGKVFIAPTDVYLDDENCLQPDLLFVSKERARHIITEKNIQGPPDLVIEIISNYTVRRDTVEKKQLYENFGVKEFWLVYPDERAVDVYFLKEKTFSLYGSFRGGDCLYSAVLEGFSLKLSDVFGASY